MIADFNKRPSLKRVLRSADREHTSDPSDGGALRLLLYVRSCNDSVVVDAELEEPLDDCLRAGSTGRRTMCVPLGESYSRSLRMSL